MFINCALDGGKKNERQLKRIVANYQGEVPFLKRSKQANSKHIDCPALCSSTE
jgi:hypothetical protein